MKRARRRRYCISPNPLGASLWEQPWHPASSQGCRKSQPQWGARAFRYQHSMVDERRDYAAGLTVAGTDDTSGIAARHLAAIEHRFEDGAGSWRQAIHADLFFGPQQDARAQGIRTHQSFHESDCAKRLERATFDWPNTQEATARMNLAQLQLLVAGFELRSRRGWYRREERMHTPAAGAELLLRRNL